MEPGDAGDGSASVRADGIEKPMSMDFDISERPARKAQEYYDEIKARYAAERDLRLAYRPVSYTHLTLPTNREV